MDFFGIEEDCLQEGDIFDYEKVLKFFSEREISKIMRDFSKGDFFKKGRFLKQGRFFLLWEIF